MYILEWRWSHETDWRYDSYIQESFYNLQQLADGMNELSKSNSIQGSKEYKIWRIRKDNK